MLEVQRNKYPMFQYFGSSYMAAVIKINHCPNSVLEKITKDIIMAYLKIVMNIILFLQGLYKCLQSCFLAVVVDYV